jgi:hypothetical protein
MGDQTALPHLFTPGRELTTRMRKSCNRWVQPENTGAAHARSLENFAGDEPAAKIIFARHES